MEEPDGTNTISSPLINQLEMVIKTTVMSIVQLGILEQSAKRKCSMKLRKINRKITSNEQERKYRNISYAMSGVVSAGFAFFIGRDIMCVLYALVGVGVMSLGAAVVRFVDVWFDRRNAQSMVSGYIDLVNNYRNLLIEFREIPVAWKLSVLGSLVPGDIQGRQLLVKYLEGDTSVGVNKHLTVNSKDIETIFPVQDWMTYIHQFLSLSVEGRDVFISLCKIANQIEKYEVLRVISKELYHPKLSSTGDIACV